MRYWDSCSLLFSHARLVGKVWCFECPKGLSDPPNFDVRLVAVAVRANTRVSELIAPSRPRLVLHILELRNVPKVIYSVVSSNPVQMVESSVGPLAVDVQPYQAVF